MTAEERKRRNAELLERLHRDGETPELMAELWENNIGLVKYAVRKFTGLSPCEDGYEDLLQHSYFSFRDGVFQYRENEVSLPFGKYIFYRIKWGISHYYIENNYTIHIPFEMQRRLKECRKRKWELEAQKGGAVTYRETLESMKLSPEQITMTLQALRRLFTSSVYDVLEDDDGETILDKSYCSDDMEDTVIEQVWREELRELLMAALQDIPSETRAFIELHYFGGLPYATIADDFGYTTGAINQRVSRAFCAIRRGRYAPELVEFMPDTNRKERADRAIKRDRDALAKLKLSESERGLLA